MKEYNKPILVEEELEIVDICFESSLKSAGDAGDLNDKSGGDSSSNEFWTF